MKTAVRIISGYTAESPAGGRFPPTRFDDTVGKLDELGLVQSAIWAGRLNAANRPIDRKTGIPYTSQGTQPPIIAADPTFEFVGAKSDGIMLPSINCNSAGAFNTGSLSNRFTPDWSVAMVFSPGATNFGGLFYAWDGSTTTAVVNTYASGYKFTAPLNQGNILFVTPNIYVNEPNIVVFCGNSATREVAAYINSLTPLVGVGGTNPWPTMVNAAWTFGYGGGYMNGKIYAGVALNESLHHANAPIDEFDPTPDLPGLLAALIRNASHDFGIPLV
jgi:hypothetical protein